MFDTVYYFTSGHPFSQYINRNLKSFPTLNTSGGSVTHAALSLANSLNARDIYLYGADFSYPLGKSYSRGTYIYDFFNKFTQKTNPLENSFFSFIMQSREIKIEELEEGLRYITKPMTGYKENLEREIENIRGKLHVKNGYGSKINIDQDEIHDLSILPVFSEGNMRLSSHDFLINYKQTLLSLPDIEFPVESYLYKLDKKQQLVWLTIIPVLASIRGDNDLTSELMKNTIDWMISRIDRHIFMEEQKKGA